MEKKKAIKIILLMILFLCSAGVSADVAKPSGQTAQAESDGGIAVNNVSDSKVGDSVNSEHPAQDIQKKSDTERSKLYENSEEIKKIIKTQQDIMSKLDLLTENMYLSSEKFGKRNGAGDYYRFINSPGVKQTENGFFFKQSSIEAKKNKSKVKTSTNDNPVIKTNDYVTFSLVEMLPDETIISETPTITVINNDKLPDVVRAAFSVGKKGNIITIATLAKQVYSNLNSYPKGVMPETTLFYKINIINVRDNDSQDMSALRNYKSK